VGETLEGSWLSCTEAGLGQAWLLTHGLFRIRAHHVHLGSEQHFESLIAPARLPRSAAPRLAGEIIPQAACSRYGLQIGAYSAPFVRLLMFLTAPISYPIGWVLDRVLGHRHTALFRRAELKALMDIHREGHEFGGQLSAGKQPCMPWQCGSALAVPCFRLPAAPDPRRPVPASHAVSSRCKVITQLTAPQKTSPHPSCR
jgi:hypothetical protein